MICNFCGEDGDANEVYKWVREKPMDEPELVCDKCMKEIHFIERVQGMTEAELEELRGKRTPCEIYSRIVGYIRPVNQWNDGKMAEWNDRKVFNLEK